MAFAAEHGLHTRRSGLRFQAHPGGDAMDPERRSACSKALLASAASAIDRLVVEISRPMGQALADQKTDKLFTDGEVYERLMGRWSRLVAEEFLGWLDVPDDLKWLDVGCGNGTFTEELIARRAPAAVTAIDSSDDQLA